MSAGLLSPRWSHSGVQRRFTFQGIGVGDEVGAGKGGVAHLASNAELKGATHLRPPRWPSG